MLKNIDVMVDNTFFVNLFLFFIVLSISYYHFTSGIILACVFIVFFQISNLFKNKNSEQYIEEFQNTVTNAWSPDLIEKFLKFQKVLNPNVVYDMKIVQQQSTPEDVDYLFKIINGHGPKKYKICMKLPLHKIYILVLTQVLR